MSIQEKPPVLSVASAEDDELTSWAEEAVRNSLSSMNEALGRMVTLTTALLAGSTALPLALPMPTYCKSIGAVLLLIALAAALWGIGPWGVHLPMHWAEGIRRQRECVITLKSWCLRISGAFLWLAFGVVVLGLWIGPK